MRGGASAALSPPFSDPGAVMGHRRSLQGSRVLITGASQGIGRSLAVQVTVLTREGWERLQQVSDQHLTGAWTIPFEESGTRARTVYPRPAGPGGSRGNVHFTGRSAIGRYLRRPREFPRTVDKISVEDARSVWARKRIGDSGVRGPLS